MQCFDVGPIWQCTTGHCVGETTLAVWDTAPSSAPSTHSECAFKCRRFAAFTLRGVPPADADLGAPMVRSQPMRHSTDTAELLRAVALSKPIITLLESEPIKGAISSAEVLVRLEHAETLFEKWNLDEEMRAAGLPLPSARELYEALNLEGAEAVRAVGRSTAPYARSWADLDVTVVDGPERTRQGGRESKVLENARCFEPDTTTASRRTTTVAPGMLCILDDQPEAWKPFLRPFVAKIEPYRVDQPIETREALAASMRYLGDLAADLLPQLRARGVVWPLPPRWTRSG